MIRLIFHCLLACLPWWAKNPIYRRLCGYRIGRHVRIGISPIVVERCRIGDQSRIGHFNMFWKIGELDIEDHVRIGHMNLVRGGERVLIERYAEILRGNVINSILAPDVDEPILPEFRLGAGGIITTGHWIDFTDAVTIGPRSIVGGRHTSIWTHNRQWTKPVSIGCNVYLGSEVRVAPGASVPSFNVVGLGSVVINRLEETQCLFAGNPARRVKSLEGKNLRLLTKKTRPDLPDDVGYTELEPNRSDLKARQAI